MALSVTRYRRAVRITALLAATAVYFYMFALAAPGPTRWSNAAQGFPPGVLAWLPNILLVGAAVAWMAAGRMPPEPSGQYSSWHVQGWPDEGHTRT